MPALCGIFIPSFRLTVQQRRRFFYQSGAAFSAPSYLDTPALSRPSDALLLSGPTCSLPSLASPVTLCRAYRLAGFSSVRFVVLYDTVRQNDASPLSPTSVVAAAPRFFPLYNRTNAPYRDAGHIGR